MAKKQNGIARLLGNQQRLQGPGDTFDTRSKWNNVEKPMKSSTPYGTRQDQDANGNYKAPGTESQYSGSKFGGQNRVVPQIQNASARARRKAISKTWSA